MLFCLYYWVLFHFVHFFSFYVYAFNQFQHVCFFIVQFFFSQSFNFVGFQFFILSVFLISLIIFAMLSLSFFFSFFFNQDYENLSEYECGFEPFDSAVRQPFDVHFYIVGLLFLIFDVELVILFPWCLNLFVSSVFYFWILFFILLIFFVGISFEWQLGVLNWPY